MSCVYLSTASIGANVEGIWKSRNTHTRQKTLEEKLPLILHSWAPSFERGQYYIGLTLPVAFSFVVKGAHYIR